MLSEISRMLRTVEQRSMSRSHSGKENKRSAVGSSKTQRRSFAPTGLARRVSGLMNTAQCLHGQGLELPSGFGQPHAMGRPVEQQGAGPVLQCPDAAAEGRLTDVPRLGRAREVLDLAQGQEVLQPGELHR